MKKAFTPPRWATQFLRWFCHPDLLPEVEGDLYELYQRWVEQYGEGKAKWRYALNVIAFFRPSAVRRRKNQRYYATNHTAMLRSYLIIAVRNLQKNKVFSLINILGLAIGMAACLLILQYVSIELSYDNFHEKADRIYMVSLKYQPEAQEPIHYAANHFRTGTIIQAEYPEIDHFTRIILSSNRWLISTETNRFQESEFYFADSSLLTMFSFPLLRGNPETALKEPNTVVLLRSTAEKYFGKDWETQSDIIGQTLTLEITDDKTPLKITGVIEDYPVNSTIQAGLIVSMATYVKKKGESIRDQWGPVVFYTFVELVPGANPEQLESKFSALLDKYMGEAFTKQGGRVDFFLHSLRELHLHTSLVGELSPGGDYQTVYILSIIAVLILLIAWVNYVNLSVSFAIKRTKEVGVRKVTGAHRGQIVSQFLLESFLLNSIAVLLAFSLVQVALPFFEDFIDQTLPTTLFHQGSFWLIFLGVLLLGSLLSGFYPALVVSGYSPIQIFSNKTGSRTGSGNLKKALNTFQFAASVSLIAFTLAIFLQVDYMQNHDLGMSLDQVLGVRRPIITPEDSAYQQKVAYLKNEWLHQSTVQQVATSEFVPGGDGLQGWGGYIRRVGSEPTDVKNYLRGGIDYDFISLYEMKLLAGRNFSRDYPSDSEAVVLTEEAMYALGFENPESAVGQHILYPINRQQDNKPIEVIGVVRNFHYHSLQSAFRPIIFNLDTSPENYFSLKVSTQNIQQTIADARKAWNETFPETPFDYFFVDEFYNSQYQAELKYGTLFGIFTTLAILIACLGLFGLSAFTIEQRIKEIGIRKVLGASVQSIVVLLSKDYVKLIILANMIAIPFTYFLVQRWLSDYAFKIDIGWWIFLLPMLIVLLIALVTVSFQTIKAALANPVDSLRNE